MSETRNQKRIQPVDPDRATGAIERLFAEVRAKFALIPNLCLLGLFQGCRACRGLMRRGATKCPHCRTPYRKSAKAAA